MRPIVCLTNDPPEMVNKLIDPTSVTWRKEIIQQCFLLVDAQKIMSIPLCTKNVEDFGHGILKIRDASL